MHEAHSRSPSSLLCSQEVFNTFTTTVLSFATISGGVFAGAISDCHNRNSKSGMVSEIVGRSRANAVRSRLETASGLQLAAFDHPHSRVIGLNSTSISPPINPTSLRRRLIRNMEDLGACPDLE